MVDCPIAYCDNHPIFSCTPQPILPVSAHQYLLSLRRPFVDLQSCLVNSIILLMGCVPPEKTKTVSIPQRSAFFPRTPTNPAHKQRFVQVHAQTRPYSHSPDPPASTRQQAAVGSAGQEESGELAHRIQESVVCEFQIPQAQLSNFQSQQPPILKKATFHPSIPDVLRNPREELSKLTTAPPEKLHSKFKCLHGRSQLKKKRLKELLKNPEGGREEAEFTFSLKNLPPLGVQGAGEKLPDASGEDPLASSAHFY